MTQSSCLICPDCRAPRSERGVPCRACGSTDPTQIVVIGAVQECYDALSVAMLAHSHSTDDQSIRIQRQTFAGTHSDAQLRNGTVTSSVSGALDVGRRGERDALYTLLAAFRTRGLNPTQLPAEDDRGEDAVIEIGNESYTVQFVTVPSDKHFWHRAAQGPCPAMIKGGTESALNWIREAALDKFRKTSPKERPRTVLALDVHHVGVLASQPILTTYLNRYPDPRLEFEFAAMWLVGPDVSSSTQIGSAIWFHI